MSYQRIAAIPYFEDTPVDVAWPNIARYRPFMAPFGAVAAEDGSGFTDVATIDSQFAALRAKGLTPILYTSPYMLAKYGLLDTVDRWLAEGVLFWLAGYDGNDDLNVSGWMKPVFCKQYSGGSTVDGLGYAVDLDEANFNPAPVAVGGDEDSLADRHKVDGSQDIGIINAAVTESLGKLVAGDNSGGEELYVRYGPSVDLPIGFEEVTLRVPFGTFPNGLGE